MPACKRRACEAVEESVDLTRLVTSLTPSAAAGIAIVCCVGGVFAAQFAAREWREVADTGPKADDRPFAKAHARASAARARAKAEAAQLASTALLGSAACVSLYAIVPNLGTEGIGALALAGCLYLIVDAVLSCIAEIRAVSDDETLEDFQTRIIDVPREARWDTFVELHPKTAKRLLHRRPGAPQEVITGPVVS